MTTVLPDALRARDTKVERKKGFALLLRKGTRRWWLAHLWSNQVTSCTFTQPTAPKFVAARHYRFVLPERARLESQSFYRAGATVDAEREEASAEFSRRVAERLADGFELFADSRELERSPKRRAK